MKRFCIAGLVALSLGLSTSAMAKDLDTVDVFVGDFVGVMRVDFNKLIANKMISDAIDQGAKSEAELGEALDLLKKAGIDYKKDIDIVAVASTEKGRVCAAIDAKVPLAEPIAKLSNDEKAPVPSKDYKGFKVYSEEDVNYVVLGEKRFLICDSKLNINPMIDNAQSDKPKTLKDRDSALYNAYNASSKSADIRAGGKMTKYLKDQAKTAVLTDETGQKSVGAADIDSGTFSLSFAKGLDLSLIAHAKSAEVATLASDLINTQVKSLLADDSLKEIGLGFVKDAIKIVNDKKDLKATINFTDAQMETIAALMAELAGSVAPARSAKPAKSASTKAATAK
ncbi:MAG: hypothetical protein IKY83_06175 [Proteobacteria bacterium]|nr:hypothetical protein [Pseudomonadota bacterium]